MRWGFNSFHSGSRSSGHWGPDMLKKDRLNNKNEQAPEARTHANTSNGHILHFCFLLSSVGSWDVMQAERMSWVMLFALLLQLPLRILPHC